MIRFFTNDVLKRMVFGTLYLVIVPFFAYQCRYIFSIVIWFLLMVEMFFAAKKSDADPRIKNLVLVVGFLYASILLIIANYQMVNLLLSILMAALVDTSAFTVGRLIGGPKLTKISPKKTWSGFLGGIMIPMIVMFVYKGGVRNCFIFMILWSVIVQLGDIFVSYGKRLLQIKDSSKIIPGHGGLWDRFDSVLASIWILFFMKVFFQV